MPARFRGLVWAAGLLLLGLGLGWGLHHFAPGHAQGETFYDDLTAEQRSQLYDSLHREVAALEHQGHVLKTVVRLIGPSVVHIEAKKRSVSRGTGRRQSVDEAGSGVVIDYNGKYYILTNRHVIKDAANEDIAIQLADGRKVNPSQVWSDPDTDVAVVALNAGEVFPARLGDSDGVEIGDFVLAVGSPFGLSHSVTYGIISAKGRRDLQLGGDDGVRFQDFMQTDAAINPGNSGGPLINLRGEVIGINTAIASNSGGNEGIGFSIPVNMVMIIARQLIDHGAVSRAFMGVNLDSKFGTDMAQQLGMPRLAGARVTGITPGSPAATARLQINDVILEFDGVRIQDDNHLVNLVSLTQVDKVVPIIIFRDRQRMTLSIRVGDRRKFEQRSQAAPGAEPPELGLNQVEVWDVDELGLSVAIVSPQIARQLRIAENLSGVVVTRVDPRGPAAGQINRWEVIDAIEHRPVAQIEDLDNILSAAEPDQALRIHLVPRDTSRHIPRTVMLKPQPSTLR
jgi:serine protease Do